MTKFKIPNSNAINFNFSFFHTVFCVYNLVWCCSSATTPDCADRTIGIYLTAMAHPLVKLLEMERGVDRPGNVILIECPLLSVGQDVSGVFQAKARDIFGGQYKRGLAKASGSDKAKKAQEEALFGGVLCVKVIANGTLNGGDSLDHVTSLDWHSDALGWDGGGCGRRPGSMKEVVDWVFEGATMRAQQALGCRDDDDAHDVVSVALTVDSLVDFFDLPVFEGSPSLALKAVRKLSLHRRTVAIGQGRKVTVQLNPIFLAADSSAFAPLTHRLVEDASDSIVMLKEILEREDAINNKDNNSNICSTNGDNSSSARHDGKRNAKGQGFHGRVHKEGNAKVANRRCVYSCERSSYIFVGRAIF